MNLHPDLNRPAGCHLGRRLALQHASAQAEDLVNGLSHHWLNLPTACRRTVLATLANPASRSDDLLLLADLLREIAALAGADAIFPRRARLAAAAHAAADALTTLAPTRA